MMYCNLTLSDTVDWMESDNWRERLIAEYWQAKIRYEKLHKRLVRLEAGKGEDGDSGRDVMAEQCRHMGNYLHCLEVRAEALELDLNSLIAYAESKNEDLDSWHESFYGKDEDDEDDDDDDDGDLYIPVKTRKKKC